MTRLSTDLAAQYGTFRLAAKLDADLAGVTALFGPSGSGKTTFLGAIAGFRKGSGRVAVDGTTWQDGRTHIPAHRRPVGTVFQDGRLFDHLSVMGNLRYAAKRADANGPDIGWDQAIDALDLGQMLDRRPATLSGGERQRVAIARSLLTRPKLMLMDEPLAALDRARKADLLPMIAALPDRFGIAVIFVSHQLDEIVQIATSLIAMRAGHVIDHGDVAEMLGALDPAITGRFEAGALLQGPVTRRDPDFAMMAIDIAGAPLWMPDTGAVATGQTVRVRVRARDVSLATGPLPGLSIRNQIPGTVAAIEADDSAFVEVHLDCGGQALRARISRMALDDLGLQPGTPVTALIKSIAFDRRLSRG